MAISIDNSFMSVNTGLNKSSDISADKLSKSIENIKSGTSDEELLNACKGFEQYFVEQVMKEFTESLDEFKDNTYMEYFGDTMVQEYAENVVENGDLGIAEMLYESMKSRGYNNLQ